MHHTQTRTHRHTHIQRTYAHSTTLSNTLVSTRVASTGMVGVRLRHTYSATHASIPGWNPSRCSRRRSSSHNSARALDGPLLGGVSSAWLSTRNASTITCTTHGHHHKKTSSLIFLWIATTNKQTNKQTTSEYTHTRTYTHIYIHVHRKQHHKTLACAQASAAASRRSLYRRFKPSFPCVRMHPTHV